MNKNILLGIMIFVGVVANSTAGFAQGAQVPFGGLDLNSESTVEITADTLSIDNESGTALFVGKVVAGVENMRLTSDQMEVVYSTESTGGSGPISELISSGNVVFSNGDEAAEADFAVFNLDTNIIVMTGNVILTQGGNALAGQKMRINLDTGIAVIEGRVQTIFQTGASE